MGGKKRLINLGALLENLPPSKDESTKEFNTEDTIEKIKSLMENDEVEFALDLFKGLKKIGNLLYPYFRIVKLTKKVDGLNFQTG